MRFTDAIFQPCCQDCSDNGSLLHPNGSKLTTDEDGNQYADVPEDTPDIPNVDFYAAAVSTVFWSYTERLDATRDYIRMAHHVAQTPTESVWRHVQRGDAANMLELAMRCVSPTPSLSLIWKSRTTRTDADHPSRPRPIRCRYGSGCEAEERLDKAIQLIEMVLARARASTANSREPTSPTTTTAVAVASTSIASMSKEVLARAHSAAALAFYSKYAAKRIAGTPLAYRHDPDLLRAATEADLAADAGLPSRAALLVAEHLVGLGRRCKVRPGPRADARFGGFKALWEAYGAQRKLASKIQERPQQFRCGAEECDVRTLEKQRLRRCGGSCPLETKPSYCSTECQRRVRMCSGNLGLAYGPG